MCAVPRLARPVEFDSRAAPLEALVATTETVELEPVVDRMYPLEQFREASDRLASVRHIMKVVIRTEEE